MGYCLYGRLFQCGEPYILHPSVPICVENTDKSKSALLLYSTVVKPYLDKKAGRYKCKEESTPGEQISVLKSNVMSTSYDWEKDAGKIGDAFDYLIELVKTSDQFGLEIKTETDDKENQIEYLISKDAQLPFMCKLINRAHENMNYIIAIIGIAILVVVANFFKQKWTKERQDLEDIVTIILSKLKHEQKGSMMELKEAITQEFGTQYNVEKLWPRVQIVTSQLLTI